MRVLSVADNRKVYIDDDDFIWIRNNTRQRASYFKCRRNKCEARAILPKFEGSLRLSHPHNHDPDTEEVRRLEFKYVVQKRAKEEATSLAEIYKQELNNLGEVKSLKFKSNIVAMCRARAKELPPTPKSIAELGQYLMKDKYKDRLVYSYNEEKREFFKATLQCEDNSTIVVYISPTFEDFAKTGVHLRLHMDASFKLRPQCDEVSYYVVIHMYIGNILYPFVHFFTNSKSQYCYHSVLKFMEDLIPNLNVELLVSNDQEAIEAAYTVFPKAVKSYYQHEEKDPKKDNLNDLELYQRDLTRILNRPKQTFWRFIEVLRDIDYNKMCYFLNLQGKKIPERTPKVTKDAETQINFKKKTYKSHAFTQTKESTFLQDFFPKDSSTSKIVPTVKSIFTHQNRSTNIKLHSNDITSATNFISETKNSFTSKFDHVITKSVLRKPNILDKTKSAKVVTNKKVSIQNVDKIEDIRSILENFKYEVVQKKFETKPISIKKLNSSSQKDDQLQLEVLLDPKDFPNEKKVPTKIGTAAVEALKVLNALKKENCNSKSTKRPVIILNPKSLVNSEILGTTKVIKITKTKPVLKRLQQTGVQSAISKVNIKSLATLCSEVLMPDHNYT